MNRLGEFERPQIGLFEYRGEDLLDTARHFGLVRSDSWIAMHLREPGGRHYHILRHYRSGTSPGIMAAVSRDDGIYFDPRKMDFLRGGSTQRFLTETGDLRMLSSLGMYIGADGVFVASDGLQSDVLAGVTRGYVKDSGLIDVEGPRMGPAGHYVMMPWEAGKPEASMHTALYYNVKGAAYGNPVNGIVVFENMWSPPATTWGASPINSHLMGIWGAFAHEFEDGSYQYGHIANWTSAGSFVNIVDNGKHISTPVKSSQVIYRPDGFADRIVFELEDGDSWECVVEANGVAIDTWKMAQSIGQTYRTGHKGHTGRVGDNRPRKSWYGVFEVFPDRLKGYVKE